MTRLSLLLLLLVIAVPARSEMRTVVGFNPVLLQQVYAASLAFITPRALDPVTAQQLTLWGLGGLTALDPDLIAGETSGQLALATPQRRLYAITAPAETSPQAWADAAVVLTAAGWNASVPVRRAGTQGIIQSFFDEMFNHLDPYSRYVPPGQAAAQEAQLSGAAGAGLTLAKRGEAIIVQSAIPGAPGAAAGIHAGDRVVSVDHQEATGNDPATVASWIAGPEFSTVHIAWRTAHGRLREADIVRSMIPPETVFSARVADLLVLRLTGFSRNTGASMVAPVEQALSGRHPPAGLVLDLRGNRGGLLAEAVNAADELLPPGVVALEQGRDPAANRVWRSENQEMAKDVPVIVLVDGRTASAAEVLAAALADRGRGVVVGSATLGKGLVQTFTTLPDNGELFVTWSRVLAPRGWPVQGLGVLPQVCTSLGEDRLEQQLALLDAGEQPMAADIRRERTARAPVPAAEAVAIRDACPAAEGREIDLEAAHWLIDHPAAYAAALLPPLRDDIAGK